MPAAGTQTGHRAWRELCIATPAPCRDRRNSGAPRRSWKGTSARGRPSASGPLARVGDGRGHRRGLDGPSMPKPLYKN